MTEKKDKIYRQLVSAFGEDVAKFYNGVITKHMAEKYKRLEDEEIEEIKEKAKIELVNPDLRFNYKDYIVFLVQTPTNINTTELTNCVSVRVIYKNELLSALFNNPKLIILEDLVPRMPYLLVCKGVVKRERGGRFFYNANDARALIEIFEEIDWQEKRDIYEIIKERLSEKVAEKYREVTKEEMSKKHKGLTIEEQRKIIEESKKKLTESLSFKTKIDTEEYEIVLVETPRKIISRDVGTFLSITLIYKGEILSAMFLNKELVKESMLSPATIYLLVCKSLRTVERGGRFFYNAYDSRALIPLVVSSEEETQEISQEEESSQEIASINFTINDILEILKKKPMTVEELQKRFGVEISDLLVNLLTEEKIVYDPETNCYMARGEEE